MTYNKAFFVFVSGIVTASAILFCMITKLFFLKNILCGMVCFQIILLGYLVFLSIFDLRKEKRVKKSTFCNTIFTERNSGR